MKYKLIIFDADGTLTPLRGSSTAEFSYTLLPGVKEKCAELRAQDVKLAIASNQSKKRDIVQIRKQLLWTAKEIGITNGRYIVWRDDERCKPNPEMLKYLMVARSTSPQDVLFVGDWETDKQAADNANVDFQWAKDFFEWKK